MQTSVPNLTDLSDESAETLDMYGPNSRVPGTYAANCLLARRLTERGVRFIQLFHRGWDQHRTLPAQLKGQCADTDQPTAALVQDLKRRGMLDDTLIVWAGEFGRTVYCQGELKEVEWGRDHHPRCFTVWMAGGGIKPGMTLGATDELCYNIAERPVHVHDLNATILHQLGIDHTKLTFRFQGRYFPPDRRRRRGPIQESSRLIVGQPIPLLYPATNHHPKSDLTMPRTRTPRFAITILVARWLRA